MIIVAGYSNFYKIVMDDNYDQTNPNYQYSNCRPFISISSFCLWNKWNPYWHS